MSRRATGLRAWVVQRVSAAYLAIFVLALAGRLAFAPPADAAAWRAWVADPWVNAAFGLALAALLLHAWVGVRDVLLDYVRPTGLRLAALALVALALAAYGWWGLRILLGVAP